MKKRVLQTVSLLLLLFTMLAAGGCMSSTTEIAKKAKELLSVKYGCDFEAVTVGNRFNKDTADVVLHPSFDESLTFKAVINTKTLECEDDFVDRAVGRDYSSELTKDLENKGLTSFAVAVLYSDNTEKETDYRISAGDFADKYHLSKIHFYWMLDDSCITHNTADLIVTVCKELSEKYNCNVSVTGYVINSSFQKSAAEIALNVSVSETSFRDYDVGARFLFAYIDGKLNTDPSTIQTEIEGS